MAAIYVYEPSTFGFSDESSLTINHNFGRDVNIQLYDEDSKVMGASIEKQDNNTTNVYFYACGSLVATTGTVVVS